MRMTTTFRSQVQGIVLPCMFAMVGCQPAADASNAVGATSSRPALHVVLRWERVSEGRNARREDYAVALQSCRVAGWPVQELSADDIGKLDTGRVEIWQDARGAYGQQRTWNLTMENNDQARCLFTVEETLTDGSQSFRELDGAAMDIPPVDATEVASMAKLLGFTRVGESQVNGQPCTRWRNQSHEVCSWSGGMAAGVSNGPVDSLCAGQLGPMAYLSPLPLQSRHGTHGTGCNLELVTMTVGKGLLPEVGRAMAELDAPAKED